MTEGKKTIFNFLLGGATLLLTALLWEQAALLTALLLMTALLMLFIEHEKSALYIYFIAFVFGPLSEAFVIYFGAWTYAEPHILGFSIWLPFIWGNAALFINRLNLYIHSFEKKVTLSSE